MTVHNKTLVLLHYFGGNAQSWKWFSRELSRKIIIVPINIPGFGGCPELEDISIENISTEIYNQIEDLGVSDIVLMVIA